MGAMGAVDRTVLIRALPYARRYARAITGRQSSGDALVADALRHLMAGPPNGLDDPGTARRALYAAIGDAVRAAHPDIGILDPGAIAAEMTLSQRMLLLLTTLEEQPLHAAAVACGLAVTAAEAELAAAREHLRNGAATRVLIIEDEPIIALDIQDLVEQCGHSVVGIAATEAEAVAMAAAQRPGLVLADINLGRGGNGAHAVAHILENLAAPVIFVTAYPERFLTGSGVEPAFVIAKPFEPTTLAVAISEALTHGLQPA